MSKKFIPVCAVLFLILLLATGKAVHAQTKPIELKLSHFMSPMHNLHVDVFAPFTKEVEEKSKGRLKITIFPGEALGKAREMSPEKVIEEVKASGLRGRGGAGFPCGVKWELARKAPGKEKVLICNADEGEVGTFKDRYIIQNDPFSLVEGIAIAAYALGVKKVYLYLRAEYEYLREGLEAVLGETARGRRAVLVGNSLGAWMAMLLAHRHPEWAERIIAIDGGAVRGANLHARVLPGTRAEARESVGQTRDPGSPPIPDFVLDDIVRQARVGPLARFAATASSMEQWTLDGRLGELQVIAASQDLRAFDQE